LAKFVILTDVDEDFIILKEIGSGNYGIVYLVEDNSTHEQFALKSISKQVIQTSAQGMNSLKNEIEILRLLNHPRIVKLHRVYEDIEKISLIMTYAGQCDLFESLLKNKKFPESLVSDLIHNLLSVLLYIHSLSIIHRDLKPENILFKTFEPNIILCDFGLSCFISDSSVARCGSPGFVAPEILLGQSYSDKVDTFAVGVITYTLLVGKSPFAGGNMKEILIKNKQCKVEFCDKVWNQFSRFALDFVKKLINPDPVSRLSAAEALNHRWMRRGKKISEFTPDTAGFADEMVEMWKVPTLVKIDKPEFRNREDLRMVI
jgi:serine/threonine protein kinase